MELIEEIEPILWSYVADVPQDHIIFNRYDEGEEERVNKAIEIINSGQIYLEYMPNYDVTKLEQVIEEHVVKHNVRHVFFDYIHITTELINEFQSEAKAHMQVREDQVLANVSTKLKDLCNRYDISIDTWTQVSGDWKNDQNRDQTIVRGAKAIIDKSDTASITSKPTTTEKKKLEKILHNMMGCPEPNVCMTYYKNRGGKYNDIKVWLYVDYSTMRVHDLFCTDKECNLISVPQTYTKIVEDKLVVVNCKESVTITDEDILPAYERIEIPKDAADYFDDSEEKSEKIKRDLEKIEAKLQKDKKQQGRFSVVEEENDESVNNDDTNSEENTLEINEETTEEATQEKVLSAVMNDDDIDW